MKQGCSCRGCIIFMIGSLVWVKGVQRMYLLHAGSVGGDGKV